MGDQIIVRLGQQDVALDHRKHPSQEVVFRAISHKYEDPVYSDRSALQIHVIHQASFVGKSAS